MKKTLGSADGLDDRLQKVSDIIEAANLGTWEWNLQTGEFQSNAKWIAMIGYTPEELQPVTTQKWAEFAHPDDLKASSEIIKKHLREGESFYNSEIRMKHKDGRWIWIETKGKITHRDHDGKPIKMFGIHMDITSRKEANEIIKESEKRFFLALDETKAGLWDYDMLKEKVFISHMWKEILGYQDNELGDYFDVIKELEHPDDKKMMEKAVEDYIEGKTCSFEVTHRLMHKDGSWRWILTRGGILRDDNKRPYRWIGTNMDITERIEREKNMIEMSNRDALTNVYNRRYIFNRLGEIIEEYKREREIFSVCILDIDFFKAVNDNYGHLAGDHILKEFAKIIEQNLRGYDILGRYGGEEFIVVLINTDKNQSAKVLNRILDIIRNEVFIFNNEEIKITFSAGISDCSEVREKEMVIDSLIDMADTRMYQAKNTGRDRIIYKN